MADAILRQIEMLRVVPHWPGKTDSSTIRSRLSDRGYDVSTRTIQRDLQKLSAYFPLICDESPGHFGWSWAYGAEPITLNTMPPHVAVSFKLVEKFMGPLIPSEIAQHLSVYFRTAGGILHELADSDFDRWADKVGVAQRAHAVVPPEMSAEVVQTVYTAVFKEACLDIIYHTAAEGVNKKAIVHPLGLVVRDPVIYLVCTFWNFDDVRQIALHRIKNAQICEGSVQRKEGFSLQRYLENNEQDIVINSDIKLKARVTELQAGYIRETPISSSQRLSDGGGGFHLLEASLKDTVQLRRWLLSLTGDIEVLEPLYLRELMIERLRKQTCLYSD